MRLLARWRRASPNGGPVAAAEFIQVTLLLASGADPVTGSLWGPDGQRRSFHGWPELVDELRRVAPTHKPTPATPTTTQEATP
jgi:hypothetical protein